MRYGEGSEREEPSASDRRAGHLLARGDPAQLTLEALELPALPILELLQLSPTALVEFLEGARPSLVEVSQGVLHAAHHPERRHERPLTVRAVEDGAGAEVLEGDGVVPAATEAADRDLPLLGRRNGEPECLGGRGGRGRRCRRGSGDRRRSRPSSSFRLRGGLRGGDRGAAPLLLEAGGRIVGNGLGGVEGTG